MSYNIYCNNNILAISNKYQLMKINIYDILYIETYNRGIKIHTRNGYEIIKINMKEIHKNLDKYFFRCHNSFIVNLYNIDKIDSHNIHINKITIPISKYRLNDLKYHLEKIKLNINS